MRAVVLVEGISDRVALEALAERRGRDLAAEGVSIVPMGGAQAIGRFLEHFSGLDVALAGLCDAGEEQVITAEGDLGTFRTFQRQLAKRDLPYEEQLWRFMWNRKARYASLLV